MDFALILVVATGVCGVIWLAEILLFRRLRLASGGDEKESIIVEYARSFFPVLLLVLVLRSFIFEPFRIPSGSMMPTLLEGDFIFVNKFSYGLRLPVLNSKILETGEPERGDVVVFRLPTDPSMNYIKRVVGLPGDIVEIDEVSKKVTINGETADLQVVGPYEGAYGIDLGREILDGTEHDVLLDRNQDTRGGVYRVPDGHYLMMGDNRDNSLDGRFEAVGYVPEDHLVGRAVRIWMSWRRPSEGGPRWSRIGRGIN